MPLCFYNLHTPHLLLTTLCRMACSAHIIQTRPLKRVKYGPPDVYPQLLDQKEDDLSDIHLKKVQYSTHSTHTHRDTVHTTHTENNLCHGKKVIYDVFYGRLCYLCSIQYTHITTVHTQYTIHVMEGFYNSHGSLK